MTVGEESHTSLLDRVAEHDTIEEMGVAWQDRYWDSLACALEEREFAAGYLMGYANMPRQRQPLKPRHNHPELVAQLAQAMDKEGVSDTPETPTIYEEPQPYGDHLRVKVIWSRWAGVPVEERGAIILDAYERAGLRNEIRRITVALGLTPEESQRLGFDN